MTPERPSDLKIVRECPLWDLGFACPPCPAGKAYGRRGIYSMNKGLLSLAAALVALCAGFFLCERKRMSSKEVPLIAVLAALAALGRIPFAALPGVQPTTFIVVISGLVFGPASGFLVGAVAAFVSNMFLGHGPWTIWQMVAWGACGASSGFLGYAIPKGGVWPLGIFAFLWGYLFGGVMNLWYWYSFVYPLTLRTWLAVSAASLPMDTLHAAGNAVFALVLGNGSLSALRYFKKRLELSSITDYNYQWKTRR